jgi:dethiobiotin synthetase
MDLSVIISAALGLLAGAVAVLKLVAPRTKNTTDDAVLKRLQALEELADRINPAILAPAPSPNPAPAPEPTLEA